MFYKFVRTLFRFLFTLFCRWEIQGLEHFPAAGPVIVIANHVSYWDPIVVGSALPRQVYFMAKRELYSYPVFGFVLKLLGAFPVNRQRPDRAAVKRALTHLEKGEVVGIFPEGTRSKTGELLSPFTGAAFFALRTGALVCPVALIGTTRIFCHGFFRKFQVRIGPVIQFNRQERRELELVARKMMEKIQELLDFTSEQAGISSVRAEKPL
ncbi:MAG: lysophospholipid acyltransferase family protein [Bacillota bacterium]|nr:lysophospholipid acyltransferase family protein [Bacillota bacterium]